MSATEPVVEEAAPARAGRRFRALWAAPVLAVVALLCWAFASPVGAAPDDDFHLASTWCADMARADLCLPGDDAAERVVSPGVAYATCFAGKPDVSAVCQDEFFDEGGRPVIPTERGNFANNYPPVYYAVMNLLASPDLQVSALAMRALNVALFVGGTVALWMLLPVRRRPVLLGMWLITLGPLGAFIVASNNPSSWAVTGVGLSWLAMLGFLETTGRRRIGLGVLAALAGVMAAGARGDSAVYTVVGFGVAAVLAFRRDRAYLIALGLPVALSILAAVFFLTSQQSAVVQTGLGDGEPVPGTTAAELNGVGLLLADLVGVPHLWVGIFGSWGLGWLDTVLPAVVWVAGIVVFSAVVFLSLRTVPRRLGVLLLLAALVLWLLPVFVLVQGGNTVGQNVQPRYLLPVLVIVAGLALLPWRRPALRLSGVQAVLVAVLLSGAHLTALNVNIRRYVTGADEQGLDLGAGAEWWWPGLPIGPTAVWVVGSVAFAALAAILVREMTRDNDFAG